MSTNEHTKILMKQSANFVRYSAIQNEFNKKQFLKNYNIAKDYEIIKFIKYEQELDKMISLYDIKYTKHVNINKLIGKAIYQHMSYDLLKNIILIADCYSSELSIGYLLSCAYKHGNNETFEGLIIDLAIIHPYMINAVRKYISKKSVRMLTCYNNVLRNYDNI